MAKAKAFETRPRGARWTEREARAALAELASTGESELAFARQRGISRQRLRYWRERLDGGGGQPAFVAVAMPAAARTAATIAIRSGEVEVCVREDLDVEQVARLVVAISRAKAC
jgi:hypothetical protein